MSNAGARLCRWVDCDRDAMPNSALCAEHLATVIGSAPTPGGKLKALAAGVGLGVLSNTLYAVLSSDTFLGFVTKVSSTLLHDGGFAPTIVLTDEQHARLSSILPSADAARAGDLEHACAELSKLSQEDQNLALRNTLDRLSWSVR